MIYALAHELETANKTRMEFASEGVKTYLSIISHFDWFVENQRIKEMIEVLVVDTETKNLSPKETKKNMRRTTRALAPSKRDIVFYRADSNLQWHIGAEKGHASISTSTALTLSLLLFNRRSRGLGQSIWPKPYMFQQEHPPFRKAISYNLDIGFRQNF